MSNHHPEFREWQHLSRKEIQAPRKNPNSSKPQRGNDNAALAAGQVQSGSSQRFLVRVTSFRKRLIDEDNLCPKFAVDCCRYAGLLPDDAPGETKIECRQEKVGKEEDEHTVIEIFEL